MLVTWRPQVILICGPGESGKTTVSHIFRRLGFKYSQSTSQASNQVVFEASITAGLGFATADECWARRREFREFWRDVISDYNGPDRLGLYRRMVADNSIIDGIRLKPELEACRREFGALSVWIRRPDAPPDNSLDFGESDCHLTLNNAGSLQDLDNLVVLLAAGLLAARGRV